MYVDIRKVGLHGQSIPKKVLSVNTPNEFDSSNIHELTTKK